MTPSPAVSIPLHFEPTIEIESMYSAYETDVLPLNYAGMLVGPVGIEPTPLRLKGAPLTTRITDPWSS
jgi:hypothetical protein